MRMYLYILTLLFIIQIVSAGDSELGYNDVGDSELKTSNYADVEAGSFFVNLIEDAVSILQDGIMFMFLLYFFILASSKKKQEVAVNGI